MLPVGRRLEPLAVETGELGADRDGEFPLPRGQLRGLYQVNGVGVALDLSRLYLVAHALIVLARLLYPIAEEVVHRLEQRRLPAQSLPVRRDVVSRVLVDEVRAHDAVEVVGHPKPVHVGVRVQQAGSRGEPLVGVNPYAALARPQRRAVLNEAETVLELDRLPGLRNP